MKKQFIKWLGGITIEELSECTNKMIKEYENEINEVKKNSFRVGDRVYLNDERFYAGIEYTLLESYNGGNCWYVSTDPNSKERREMSNGVHIKNISLERPKYCHSCGSPLLAAND